MSRYSKQSFFFHQQKPSRQYKRAKKIIDTQSLLGDKREPILVFRPGADTQEELGNIRLQAHNRQRRPSSAVSRKSSVWFPAVDVTGPHLTTNKALLEEEEEPVAEREPNYKFNEIKFASTAILSTLSRRLDQVDTNSISEIELPESLVNSLIVPHHQLVADTIVERREWQTDCYTSTSTRNNLFLTDTPEQDNPLRHKVESSFNKFVEKQRRGKGKMSKEDNSKPERPLTAKSTMSGVSIKSELSNISETDSKVDYDKLPPELRMQGPEILRHRRESKNPSKPKIPGPRTRLERFNEMKEKAAKERKKKALKAAAGLSLFSRKPTKKPESIEDTAESVHVVKVGMEMISFSLSSKTCADHGWIIHPSKTNDPEGYTLHQWASTRLQEAMRQREESYLTAKLRGEDGPLVVKYYSDPHYKPFKGARHRASSFPLPAVLSKLPPSLCTFSSHTHNDMFYTPMEGQVMCVLLLPDGSGFCKYVIIDEEIRSHLDYYSGRKAISISRKGDGSRGIYVLVYDDTNTNSMIGCFMPDGRVSCYHRHNGAINLVTDSEGGVIMDEEGFITRKWTWPQSGEKMPYSISVQLNTHVLFQCSGQYQMTLKFSCHGQMQRFPVGLQIEYMDLDQQRNDAFWMKRDTIISSRLQSNLPFESTTARNNWQRLESDEVDDVIDQSVKSVHTNKPQSREAPPTNGSGLLTTDSLTRCDDESSTRKHLQQYKVKVKTIVEDWLNHYRQTIGIAPPSRGSLQDSFISTNNRLSLSRGGVNQSRSMSRSSTRGWSQPCAKTPLSPFPSRPITPLDQGEELIQRSISPLEQFIKRPTSQERKPFKVGPALPRKSQPIRIRPGCPVALHSMILKKTGEMPSCRCDKRKIPTIQDLELDVYLSTHVPSNQLIIINITTSNDSRNDHLLPLLVSLHEKQNTSRYAPCQQSGRDVFRILKYDLCSACSDLNTTTPLLRHRHNVEAGMFMMYMSGKLLGILTGFNGYGTTKKDFLKQVQRSINNGLHGQYLPNDFKFSSSSVKLHSSSLWALPLSGVHDELISVTPSSVGSANPTPDMASYVQKQ